MKFQNRYLLFFIIFSCGQVMAQAPAWLWANSATGFNDEVVYSVTTDAIGNSYATGSFGSTSTAFGSTTLNNAGFENMFLVKYDPSGNVIWAKQAGGTEHDFGYSVVVDPSGNCYVAGGYGSDTMRFDSTHLLTNSNPNYYNIFIAKYDVNGNVVWVKSAGGTSYDWAESISLDVSGNCYITGTFLSPTITFDTTTLTSFGTYDFYLAKYDPAGNLVWVNQYGSNGQDRGLSVSCDNSGHCYLAGTFLSSTLIIGSDTLINSSGSGNIMLMKFDTAGNALWARSAGGISDDGATGVAADAFGNCYVTGHYESGSVTFGSITITNTTPYYNLFLAKYNAAGTAVWARGVGGPKSDFANAVAADNYGNAYITGRFQSTSMNFGSFTVTNGSSSGTVDNTYVAKYDSTGTVLWAKDVGGNDDTRGYTVAVSVNDNCFFGGSFDNFTLALDTIILQNPSSFPNADLFVAKLDVDPNGIGDELFSSNDYLIYPNPATDKITIKLPAVDGEISVMNATGQLVYTTLTNSRSELSIDTHLLSTGIYFLRFISGEAVFAEKFVIEH
jgi:hypothetical protein